MTVCVCPFEKLISVLERPVDALHVAKLFTVWKLSNAAASVKYNPLWKEIFTTLQTLAHGLGSLTYY